MVKDHNGHKLELSKVAASEGRKKLMEKLKPLKKSKDQPVTCYRGGTNHQV